MRKLKVLFIITQSEEGGAQRWVYDTATHLDANRYQSIVASGETKASRALLEKLTAAGIKTYALKNLARAVNPWKDLKAIIELYRLMKNEQPDILQLCSTKTGILGSIAGKLAGQKIILYRIGGWAFNDPRPHWQNSLFLWLEKITAPLKTTIIVNSKKGYDEALARRICTKQKLALIYNGITTQEQPKKIYEQTKRPFTTLTIANYYTTKGLMYLLEAARILKSEPITFIIIGDGPERKTLEDSIQEYQLTNVVMKGTVAHAASHISEYDCLIIPSVKEGMPYVLLEGLAAGIPIITTNVGGIPEIIRDGENGLLVPPKSREALAEAVARLASDPALRAQLSRAAKESSTRYTLKTMIAEYEALLEPQIL